MTVRKSKAKMSTLMKRGAAKLPASTGQHFTHDNEGNITGACAIGCAIYESGLYKQDISHNGMGYLPAKLYNTLDMRLKGRDLPADVRGLFRADVSYVFYYIIAETNDKISRERAIKLVREMGY
jgi:hypothetical protein